MRRLHFWGKNGSGSPGLHNPSASRDLTAPSPDTGLVRQHEVAHITSLGPDDPRLGLERTGI